MVNIEKIRVVQGADLASVPATESDTILLIDRDSDIANGTLPFPANPIKGQILMVASRINVGSVTLDSNGRQVIGAINTLSANDFVGWIYEEVGDKWFPYGMATPKDLDLLAYQALGSPFLAETVGQTLSYANTASNLVDGQIRYIAVYLPKAASLTGVKFYVRVQGSYTADNNNRVGLYSYAGGVLTLVASCANTANLWTSAANAIMTVPFTASYAATSGIYFIALLFNQSAQVTAPALASGVALNNAAMAGTAYGFANSAKLLGVSSSADLPASINMTTITASAIPTWAALY